MQGKLIVLEGIDGSGKSTQFQRLCARLDAEGREFTRLVFPRYSEPSSALIRMYLGGEFGGAPGDVNPYMASAFYAVDRCASYLTDWRKRYRDGGLVLSDRYTTANAVHQGAKLGKGDLAEYLDWLEDFEYEKLALPRPDAVIYLDLDAETAMSRMRERQLLTRTEGDIHETDLSYLASCVRAGDFAASHCGWIRVKCLENGAARGVDDIHEEIYSILTEALHR